jgi:hypothetical protein
VNHLEAMQALNLLLLLGLGLTTQSQSALVERASTLLLMMDNLAAVLILYLAQLPLLVVAVAVVIVQPPLLEMVYRVVLVAEVVLGL